jgi:hypothetical protein
VAVLRAFETTEHGLLRYLDRAFPVLRERLRRVPFAVLDLTDLLRTEDVFSDAIHFHPGSEDYDFGSYLVARAIAGALLEGDSPLPPLEDGVGRIIPARPPPVAACAAWVQ